MCVQISKRRVNYLFCLCKKIIVKLWRIYFKCVIRKFVLILFEKQPKSQEKVNPKQKGKIIDTVECRKL